MQQAQNFFSDKKVIAQAQGVQGNLYKMGSYLQSAWSSGLVDNTLALPMKSVEIMWNAYGNSLIQKVFGIPLILNMTQTFKTGPGYTIEEVHKYIPLNGKSLVKTIKKKIIHWLS